jgi:hypothetical protein
VAGHARDRHLRGRCPLCATVQRNHDLCVMRWVYASATHADRGVVEVSGSNLDKESLIEITRSSAASGNTVSAKIETKGIVENIPLKGVAASFSVSQGEDEPSLFNLMQDRYSQVRHANN